MIEDYTKNNYWYYKVVDVVVLILVDRIHVAEADAVADTAEEELEAVRPRGSLLITPICNGFLTFDIAYHYLRLHCARHRILSETWPGGHKRPGGPNNDIRYIGHCPFCAMCCSRAPVCWTLIVVTHRDTGMRLVSDWIIRIRRAEAFAKTWARCLPARLLKREYVWISTYFDKNFHNTNSRRIKGRYCLVQWWAVDMVAEAMIRDVNMRTLAAGVASSASGMKIQLPSYYLLNCKNKCDWNSMLRGEGEHIK